MTNKLSDLMKYYLFCTNRLSEAGISNSDVSRNGGYEKFRSLLHNKATSEYLKEKNIPYSQESFVEARKAISREIAEMLSKEECQEYRGHIRRL